MLLRIGVYWIASLPNKQLSIEYFFNETEVLAYVVEVGFQPGSDSAVLTLVGGEERRTLMETSDHRVRNKTKTICIAKYS